MTAGGSSDAFMCDQAWNCWLMTVKKVAVEKKTEAQGGSTGLASRQAATKGSAGLNTLCTLLANWRSVIVQGRWWCACVAAVVGIHQRCSVATRRLGAGTSRQKRWQRADKHCTGDALKVGRLIHFSTLSLSHQHLKPSDLRAKHWRAAIAVVVHAPVVHTRQSVYVDARSMLSGAA